MTLSIRRLGLVGGILAILFIIGLNFTALEKQWDVPYIGVEKAHAAMWCVMGYCTVVTPTGSTTSDWSCWEWIGADPYNCGNSCPSC